MTAAVDTPTELELRAKRRSESEAVAPVVDTVMDVTTRLDRLNSLKLADTYRELGIKPPPPIVETAKWEATRYQMTTDGSVRAARRDTAGVVVYDLATTEPSEGAQEAIGKHGTKVTDGRVEVEQNFRLRPFQARGRLSQPGLFEEAYRVEPVAFKNVNEISALICGATYEPQVAENTDAAVATEVARQHRAIARAMFNSDFLQNASSFLKNGFAFFEQGWHEELKVIDWFEFREPSTVYRWLFDDRQTRWLGTEFQVGGTASETYVIPQGREIWSARTMLINLHAQGNNLEGISPLRLVVALRKMKELILQAFAIGYTKYAVPIATIVHELTEASAAIIAQLGASEHKGEVQDLINRLQNLRSRLGAVIPVPAGWKLEFQNPTRDMPDPVPLLTYIDTMIALVFANEGALLGSSSFGSYAMAAKSDEKFMRAAPAYAMRIGYALTKLLHVGLEINGFDLRDIETLPMYSFRFNGTQDASAWIEDVTKVMAADPPPSAWPSELRRATAAKFGLKADVLDPTEERAEQVAADLQTTALNGAQVSSMVQVLSEVALGNLPAESAIRILMRAFGMSREEAEGMVKPAEESAKAAPQETVDGTATGEEE